MGKTEEVKGRVRKVKWLVVAACSGKAKNEVDSEKKEEKGRLPNSLTFKKAVCPTIHKSGEKRSSNAKERWCTKRVRGGSPKRGVLVIKASDGWFRGKCSFKVTGDFQNKQTTEGSSPKNNARGGDGGIR